MGKLIFGIGVNDADYKVKYTISGKKFVCKYYSTWVNMLNRCYSEKFQKSWPTYIGCFVCDEWLTFSRFKSWMEKQDWEGNHLDKDLLFEGNKKYSSETCIFIPPIVNTFMTDSKSKRGKYPIGVDWNDNTGKFRARCSNLGSGSKSLGRFDNPESAHKAYVDYKFELAKTLSYQQKDIRISDALLRKYQPSE